MSGYSRQRDTQRSKLYRAERVLDPFATPLPTVQDVERYVKRIEASKRVQRKLSVRKYMSLKQGSLGKVRGIRVHDGRGHRRAVSYGGTIAIPKWARKDWVVLHELAHEFTPRSERTGGAHGWEFAAAFLYLVRLFMGKEAHDALKSSFRANRVRYTKPRQKRVLTEGEKDALRDRLLIARLAKQERAAKEKDQ